MEAIVYTSNTGSTERYAKLLAKATGLPVYPAGEALGQVRRGAEVIYLGWIMAGKIQGYAKAAKRYQIRAVCGVGMAQSEAQAAQVRRQTAVSEKIPLFALQGDFDVKKLRGIYRLMMELMVKAMGRQLEKPQDRTPEEQEMLERMVHGGVGVRAENLQAVLAWYAGAGEPKEGAAK